MLNFYFLKNLIFLNIRFLILLFSIFIFSCSANFLSLKNDKVNCFENNCLFSIKNNQELRFSKDDRVMELIQNSKKNEKEFKNYLFYTTDITDLIAYSGKPLEFLISLRSDGLINDLKLMKHSEPILLIGIPIEKLLEAVSFYKGKNIKNKINIGEDISGGVSIPIIAGATVTSMILHETILNTSREVGRLFNIISNLDFPENSLNDKFNEYSWFYLLKIGAIKHYCLDSSFIEGKNANQNNLLIDMYFADLRHPSIGKNILGEVSYINLIKSLDENESAIIILNNGSYSFKGSGFVRGGIFDRFRIKQDDNVFIFRDTNFKNIYNLELLDIYDFKESGIFTISGNYKPWKPWNLILLLNYKTFYINYSVPDILCSKSNVGVINIWKSKLSYIILFMFLWVFVIFVFVFRNILSKNSFLLSIIYNCILLLDIYIIGFLFKGQPSIVNIFALFDNLKYIETLLLDPSIFLGWLMIMCTIFIWGKSLFCGWICPFGALQEILFKIRSLLLRNDLSIEFSWFITNKLKYIKYFIFIFLMLVSFKSITQAEMLIDIEPFKTVWVIGIFNRSFFVSLYTILLLLIALFTYRFFCRFICPLGGFLSLLSFIILFRIKRRTTCTVCKICRIKCNSRAIDNFGFVDSKECFGCLSCINNMYNLNMCPPIKSKKN